MKIFKIRFFFFFRAGRLKYQKPEPMSIVCQGSGERAGMYAQRKKTVQKRTIWGDCSFDVFRKIGLLEETEILNPKISKNNPRFT